MRILDLTAGMRGIWFDKNYPDATFVDIRSEVNPTYIADSGALPPEVGFGYDLIVFDPPHMKIGPNAQMATIYGSLLGAAEIRNFIQAAAKEAHRVSRCDALMAFKWNDHDQKLEAILSLLKPFWEPLFGQKVSTRTKHASSTYWVMLRRKANATNN